MENRLRTLPSKVQIRVYEMAGMAGTICLDDTTERSKEYNQAIAAFMLSTPEEMRAFLSYYRRYPVHESGRAINWYGLIRSDKREYDRYLRSNQWNEKRQAVFNRAMRSFIIEPVRVQKRQDRYGRLIKSFKTERKPICESLTALMLPNTCIIITIIVLEKKK